MLEIAVYGMLFCSFGSAAVFLYETFWNRGENEETVMLSLVGLLLGSGVPLMMAADSSKAQLSARADLHWLGAAFAFTGFGILAWFMFRQMMHASDVYPTDTDSDEEHMA